MHINIREQRKIGTWLNCGDTGQSSLTMAAFALGGQLCEARTPSDPSDFRRCYDFLQDCINPSNRMTLIYEMGGVTKKWKALADNWLRLEMLYKKELKRKDGNAPELFELMQKIGL